MCVCVFMFELNKGCVENKTTYLLKGNQEKHGKYYSRFYYII